MKKLLCIFLALLLLSLTLVACNNGGTSGGETTDAPTGGGDQTEGQPDSTGADTEPAVDEDELYYYNPRIEKCYRKNDKTVLFTVDTKVKDPDGNLFEHIYVAATPDGEPIARAVSTNSYDGDMSKLWGANFDVALPETFYLCFKAVDGEDAANADLSTVLCDVVNLGIYGQTKLSDGSRVAAIQNGTEVIEATLWVEANINFNNEPDVTFFLPDTERDVLILHEADMQSVLLAAFSGPGAYVEFKFTGTGVNVYSNVDNDSVTNDLKIYIDGELVETVDDRNAFSFVKEGLTAGEHTVKVVAGENSTSESAVQADPHANKNMFYISGIRYTAE